MSKETGKKAAQAASKVLRDPKASKAAKTAAGSALSQTEPKKKKQLFGTFYLHLAQANLQNLKSNE